MAASGDDQHRFEFARTLCPKVAAHASVIARSRCPLVKLAFFDVCEALLRPSWRSALEALGEPLWSAELIRDAALAVVDAGPSREAWMPQLRAVAAKVTRPLPCFYGGSVSCFGSPVA